MGDEHPSPEVIVRFAAGEAVTREESRQVVRHLLHGCPACGRLLIQAFQPEVDASSYDQILDDCVASLRRTRRQA
jgi:hypothetical protein